MIAFETEKLNQISAASSPQKEKKKSHMKRFELLITQVCVKLVRLVIVDLETE